MNKRKQKQRNHQEYPGVNRKFKDRLFRLVFSDRQNLLELYNAVNHTSYTNAEDLEVNTLENAVYLSMKNDISFLIGGTMNLYEHQSSYNPNMPIRGLLYFAKLYEKYVEESDLNLYGEVLSPLPMPRYLVFYNGRKEEEDETVLRLTDAFIGKEHAKGADPALECVAVMLNINYGHNRELMGRCRKLEEYAIFVGAVRRAMTQEADKRKAVVQAVDECIEKGILRDILVKHKAEVVGMVLTTFDQKKYERLMQKEWKEQGLEEGRQEGRQEAEAYFTKEVERFEKLNLFLIREKKYEELEQASREKEYREELYREYHI